MARSQPGQVSFNGGELSPLLAQRVDLARQANGCTVSENMLPTVQGPSKRRGGLRFTASTKTDGKVWVCKFSFSRTQSYLLEFGHLYIRFYANHAQLSVMDTAYEVVTPYTLAQLTNEDGSFALDVDQSEDVLYITSGDHSTKMLRRLGAVDFELVEFVSKNGPFQDLNANKSLRLYAGDRNGSTITVTASAAYFTASMVGAPLRLDVENFTIPPWEPNKHFAQNDLVRSDGKTYRAVQDVPNQVTGTKTPIHESGSVIDGSGETTDDTPKPIGILWEFRDAGSGIGQIVEFTDSTHVVVNVPDETAYPDGVVGSGNATNVWWIGAWGTHPGAEWPRFVCQWKNRLIFFGNRRGWMSVPNEFDNFARDIVGEVRPDASIVVPIPTTDRIRWIEPGYALLVGTEGGEWIVNKQTPTDALGPNNIDAYQKAAYGSRALQPLTIGDSVLFAESAGQCVRQAIYDPVSDSIQAQDITVYAEHIARGVIVDWAWAQQPDRILWVVTAAGELLSCTMESDQDVLAWGRHPTNGFVEAVEVLPSPDGKRDDLWVVVRRMVGGVPRRFVEYLDAGDEAGRAQEDWFYVDAGLTYSGPAVTQLSGLDHLSGEWVQILANGAVHPLRQVSSDGKVTLKSQATKAQAGLGSRAVICPMPPRSQRGLLKIVKYLVLAFHRTLGCKIGPALDNLSPLIFRKGHDELGVAPPPFTGMTDKIPFEGDYERMNPIYLVQDQPLPMTLTAVIPDVVTSDGD